MFEEKIKCIFCREEKPSDETIEGICLDCLEDYYTPERAIRFLADTNKEKEFYVEVYMEANCSEANSRMVDLCKAEFHKGLKFIEFQMKNLSSIDEYLLENTFEYPLLKYWNPQQFDIVGCTSASPPYQLVKKLFVNGQELFGRVLIQRKKN